MPDFGTIIRYGKACGTSIGLLFAVHVESDLSIVTAVTLQAADGSRSFEPMSGHSFAVVRPLQASSSDA